MQESKKIDMLRRVSFFKNLKNEVIEKLAGLVTEISISREETLFSQGDPGDSLYIVISGEGVILKSIEDDGEGKEKSLGFIGPGDLVGEMAFFDQSPRSATISARTDMKLFKLDKVSLDNFFFSDSQSASIVFNEVIKVLSQRLRESARELVAIYETSKVIALSNDEVDLLEKAFKIIIQAVINEDSGFLSIYNKFTEEFEIKAYEGFSVTDLGDGFLSRKEPLLRNLMETRQVYQGNPSEDELLFEGRFNRAKSVMAAPIYSGNNFLGAIALFNHVRENAFHPSERNLIGAVCHQIALALDNVSLKTEYRNLEKLGRIIW